jgi:predicted kinase
MEMILFIGIQAAGKTSFYRERFFDTHVRISMDLLRTRYREQVFMRACLSTRQRFVIDNTNPTRADRARYIEPARKARFRVVGYFFEPDPAACYERNQGRAEKQRVPAAGLFGTLKLLERPCTDEGFDELYLVHAREGRFELAPL